MRGGQFETLKEGREDAPDHITAPIRVLADTPKIESDLPLF